MNISIINILKVIGRGIISLLKGLMEGKISHIVLGYFSGITFLRKLVSRAVIITEFDF